MADVFLSYRNTAERRAFVKRLALLLRAHEVSVWWDYGLEAGESYRAQITEELSKSRIVAPLWCLESIASKWVRMEAELGKDKLVPARLQKVVPPEEFEAIQAADLTDWDGSVQHPRVLAFVARICARLGKPGRAPVDMMEELADLRMLVPLPDVTLVAPVAAAPAQDFVLADLRATWAAFPARDDSASVEKFLARVRGTAPGSGLEFEIEHALGTIRQNADLHEQASWAIEKAARGEVEPTAARETEIQRRYPPGAEFRDGLGLPLMVAIPSGQFSMGSPRAEVGRFETEGPQSDVCIRHTLAVGKYPVLVREWRTFVDSTKWSEDEKWSSPSFEQGDDHPVTFVNWYDAQAYADWISKRTGETYRLLTEAEWEYVCRAGAKTRYATGDNISPAQANFNRARNGTTTIGAYSSNRFGLHDMHGNIREWVQDCWRENLEGQPADGTAFDSNRYSYRVNRGGSWLDDPQYLRSAYRGALPASNRNYYLGFRVAKVLVTP